MATLEIQPRKRENSEQQLSGWIQVNVKLPRYGQYVLYRTDNYQALGCFDRPGVWRFSDGEPEQNAVKAWQAIN